MPFQETTYNSNSALDYQRQFVPAVVSARMRAAYSALSTLERRSVCVELAGGMDALGPSNESTEAPSLRLHGTTESRAAVRGLVERNKAGLIELIRSGLAGDHPAIFGSTHATPTTPTPWSPRGVEAAGGRPCSDQAVAIVQSFSQADRDLIGWLVDVYDDSRGFESAELGTILPLGKDPRRPTSWRVLSRDLERILELLEDAESPLFGRAMVELRAIQAEMRDEQTRWRADEYDWPAIWE